MGKHVIGTQIMDTRFDQESEAFRFQNKLSDVVKGPLTLKMEEAIDSIFDSDENYRFERIVLDLGAVTYSEIESVFVERACQRLKEALADAKRKVIEGHGGGEKQDSGDAVSVIEIVEHYLLKGYLPWWAFDTEFSAENAIIDIARENPGELSQMIRRVGKSELARKRLKSQFGIETMRKIVATVVPQEVGFISEYVADVVETNKEERFVSLEASALERNVWGLVLDYLLADHGSTFNRQSFLESTLRSLASQYNTDYRSLLSALTLSVGGYAVSTGPYRELLNTLEILIEVEDSIDASKPGEDSMVFDRIRALEIYLRHGALPWRYPTPGGESLRDWVEMLFEEDPEVIKDLMLVLGGQGHAWERLAGLVAASHLTVAIEWVFPNLAESAQNVIGLMGSLLEERGICSQSGVKRIVWSEALKELSTRRAEALSLKEFIGKLADRLGARLNVDGVQLLVGLVSESPDEKAAIDAALQHRGFKSKEFPEESARKSKLADVFVATLSSSRNADSSTSLQFNDDLAEVLDDDPQGLKDWLFSQSSEARLLQVANGANRRNLESLLVLCRRSEGEKAIRLVSAFQRKAMALSLKVSRSAALKNDLLQIALRFLVERRHAALDSGALIRLMLYHLSSVTGTAFYDLLQRLDAKETGDEISENLDALTSEYRLTLDGVEHASEEGGEACDSPADWVALHDAVKGRLFERYLPYWAAPYAGKSLGILISKWVSKDVRRSLAKLREWSSSYGVFDALAENLELESFFQDEVHAIAFQDEAKGRLLRALKESLEGIALDEEKKSAVSKTLNEIALYELLVESPRAFDPLEFTREALDRVAWTSRSDGESLRLAIEENCERSELREIIIELGTTKKYPKNEYDRIEEELNDSALFKDALRWVLPGGDLDEVAKYIEVLFAKGVWQASASEISTRRNLSALLSLIAKRRKITMDDAARLLGGIRRLPQELSSLLKDLRMDDGEKDSGEIELPSSILMQGVLTWNLEGISRTLLQSTLDDLMRKGLWDDGQGRFVDERNLTLLVLALSDHLSVSVNSILEKIRRQASLSNWIKGLIDSLLKKSWEDLEALRRRAHEDRRPDKAPISQKPTRDVKPVEDPIEEAIYASNSGLVLLHPYLKLFFSRLNLMDNDAFVNEAARARSIGLLQFLVTGLSEWEEHHLVLNKIICGFGIGEPVETAFDFTDEEVDTSEGLLKAFMGHWGVPKSIAGLRGDWLIRDGRLIAKEERWELAVEKKPYDLLLSSVPVGLSIVNLEWMRKPISVKWS